MLCPPLRVQMSLPRRADSPSSLPLHANALSLPCPFALPQRRRQEPSLVMWPGKHRWTTGRPGDHRAVPQRELAFDPRFWLQAPAFSFRRCCRRYHCHRCWHWSQETRATKLPAKGSHRDRQRESPQQQPGARIVDGVEFVGVSTSWGSRARGSAIASVVAMLSVETARAPRPAARTGSQRVAGAPQAHLCVHEPAPSHGRCARCHRLAPDPRLG